MALYFCFADAVLITQILYYNYINSRDKGFQSTGVDIEDRPDQPLISRRPSDIGLPGSRRRSSVTQKRQGAAAPSVVRETGGQARPWLKNCLSVLAVCALGTVGFYVAFIAGFWKPTIENPEYTTHDSVPAQILGYLSAVRLSLFHTSYTLVLLLTWIAAVPWASSI